MREGHETYVRPREQASGNEAQVRSGISETDLAHVFTPFFGSGNPEARERPGTGLGLSIIERVVVWLPRVVPDDPL